MVYNGTGADGAAEESEVLPADSDDDDALDCLDGLRPTFGELRLARVEVRPVGHQVWTNDSGHGEDENDGRRRGRQRTELLLGDIHTDGGGTRRGRRYRPTAMQPQALVRAWQVRVEAIELPVGQRDV